MFSDNDKRLVLMALEHERMRCHRRGAREGYHELGKWYARVIREIEDLEARIKEMKNV